MKCKTADFRSIQHTCHMADVLFKQMHIDVVGDFDRGMSEQLADDLHINTFGKKHTGKGMAQGVNAIITVNACVFQNGKKRAFKVALQDLMMFAIGNYIRTCIRLQMQASDVGGLSKTKAPLLGCDFFFVY